MIRRVLALSICTLVAVSTAQADEINEFLPNPTGSDPATTSIEISGTAGASYSGFLSTIDSDQNSGGFIGTIDRQTAVSGTYDANGLALISVDDLENPSFTMVYSSGDGGGLGFDLDADGDGILDDISGFGTVFDAVNSPDSSSDAANTYASQLGGIDLAYTGDEPRLTFRDGTTGTWWSVNDPDGGLVFDEAGNSVLSVYFDADPLTNTFGSINPSFTGVPEPAAAGLLGLIGLVGVCRRRRS